MSWPLGEAQGTCGQAVPAPHGQGADVPKASLDVPQSQGGCAYFQEQAQRAVFTSSAPKWWGLSIAERLIAERLVAENINGRESIILFFFF